MNNTFASSVNTTNKYSADDILRDISIATIREIIPRIETDAYGIKYACINTDYLKEYLSDENGMYAMDFCQFLLTLFQSVLASSVCDESAKTDMEGLLRSNTIDIINALEMIKLNLFQQGIDSVKDKLPVLPLI